MQSNLTLKDLIDISVKVHMCKVGTRYVVDAYTNVLGGEINAFIRIDSQEDTTMDRTVLFCFRSGDQLSLSDLSYNDQLIIPQEDLAKIKYSLGLSFELFGAKNTIFSAAINKINSKHLNDTNNNFEPIDDNLPIPDFKYNIEKKSEFQQLKKLKKKRKAKGNGSIR